MALQAFIGPQIEFTVSCQPLFQSVLYFLTAVIFTKVLSETGILSYSHHICMMGMQLLTCVEGVVFHCLKHHMI